MALRKVCCLGHPPLPATPAWYALGQGQALPPPLPSMRVLPLDPPPGPLPIIGPVFFSTALLLTTLGLFRTPSLASTGAGRQSLPYRISGEGIRGQGPT